MERSTVVVTGGAGFIGSELVRQLAGRGDHVVIVDSLVNGKRENVADVLSSRYGRMGKVRGPGVRSGSARLANSHSSLRVSRGSMISSTQKVSAVRNGERS